MTLADLIKRFRTDANDKAVPYFWSDDEVTAWLNDAMQEAVIRGRLIYECADASVCRINVTPAKTVYPLHASLYEIVGIRYQADDAARSCPIKLVSVEWLDMNVHGWRSCEHAPQYAVQEDRTLRLVPAPISTGIITLEGYRLPKVELEDPDDTPEINKVHHRHLVQWALHQGFSIPDTEVFDPERAARAEDAFTRYFGQRPDSDLRRTTREDSVQHVEAFWV